MNQYKEARNKGGQYLLQQFHADGSFRDQTLEDYYKVPAAFQVCGHTHAATRLCSWIRTTGMSGDGDFGPRNEFTSGYFNVWVILAAQRLGQYDLGHRLT